MPGKVQRIKKLVREVSEQIGISKSYERTRTDFDEAFRDDWSHTKDKSIRFILAIDEYNAKYTLCSCKKIMHIYSKKYSCINQVNNNSKTD